MKSVDVKDLGKIAVVMGGSSGEREVSLMSGSGVLKALQSVGADVVKFDPAEQPLSDLAGIDRAFLILHGKGGEDGVIQGVMEFLKIPYTGSGVQASAIGIDKEMTKAVWEAQRHSGSSRYGVKKRDGLRRGSSPFQRKPRD